MAEHIPTAGVHHGRLTVNNIQLELSAPRGKA
jgi:hypothetical protein